MKKLTILLISLFTFLTVFAGEVTEQQALLIAQKFVQGKQFKQKNLRRAPLENVENKAYYVFNVENNSGFVIVAGNDHMPEILGYSERGNFDLSNAPSNVRWWLSQYEKAASTLTGQTPKAATRRTEEAKAEIAPFITTTWGQGYPYNSQCPQIDGTNCQTGCVATAMAQVMNYTRCPKGETGEIAAYTTKTNGLSLKKLDATTFPWDNMTNDDIARLMRYCGQSVSMDYGISESSANDVRIPGALIGKFGYDKAIRLVYRNGYSSETWENMIYAELQAGRPVIYGGQSNTGGHSFILHGYQDGRFYINWGWDGSYDGYFELSALNPMYDNDRTYGRDQTAVIGIQKSTGGDAANTPKVTVTKLELTSEASVTRTSSSDNFTGISLEATLMNSFADGQTAQIGYALYQGDEQKQVISSENASFTPAVALTSTATLSFGSALADGTYRIVPVYRENETSEWITDEGSNYRYVEATITGNSLELKRMPDAAHDERLKFRITDEAMAFVAVEAANSAIEGDIAIPASIIIDDREYIVNEIRPFAFERCENVTSITLPNTITNIDGEAFLHCIGLKSFTIPRTVTYIGGNPFVECFNLEQVNVEKGSEIAYDIDGVFFYKNEYYGLTLATFPCNRSIEEYVVPDGVKMLDHQAFGWNPHIKKITIPSSVTRIFEGAIFKCENLESVNIPEGVTWLAGFWHCPKLTEVTIPQSVEIFYGSFLGCTGLKSVSVKKFMPITIPADCFEEEVYENATLFVPSGRSSIYKSNTGWSYFKHIEEIDMPDVIGNDDPFESVKDNQMIQAYFYPSNTSQIIEEGFGGKKAGKYKGTIKLSSEMMQPFVNNKMKYVRFSLTDDNIFNVRLYFSHTLEGKPFKIQDVPEIAVGWNVVELDEPYEILGDDVFVGVEWSQMENCYPLTCVCGYEVDNIDGCGYMYGPYNEDGSSTWVDYITDSFNSRVAVSIQTLIEGDYLPQYDMKITYSQYAQKYYGKDETKHYQPISFFGRNCGKKAINNYVIKYQIDDREPKILISYLSEMIFSGQLFDDGTLYSEAKKDICNLQSGKHQIKFFISEIDGMIPEFPQNDTITVDFSVIGNELPRNKWLIEQYTATWCPYTKDMDKSLEYYLQNNTDAVRVAIHISDEFSCEASDSYSVFTTFTPSYKVNRFSWTDSNFLASGETPVNQFEIKERTYSPSCANVFISDVSLEGNVLKFTASGKCTEDLSLMGTMNLTVLLTEDKLIAGKADAENGYIDNYEYNGVIRTNVTPVWGEPIKWDGMQFTKEYSYNLNASWKPENLNIVAFIGHPFDGSNYDDIHILDCNDFAVKDAEIIESPVIPGDVTGSGTVDVQDATLVVNYILGNGTDEYNYDAADMNNDGEIDVFDVTAIINVILGGNNNAAPSRRSLERDDNIQESVTLTSEDNNVLMGIDDAAKFTSFQFDVKVPKGVELTGVDWNANTDTHLLKFAKTGEDCYTVVALSMESAPLPNWSDALLKLHLSKKTAGEVFFDNILFVTPQGEAVHFDSSSLNLTTGIQSITHEQNGKVYDLSGRRLNVNRGQLSKGVYVINNKKVVIK